MRTDNNKIKLVKRRMIFTAAAAGIILIALALMTQPVMAKGKGLYSPYSSPDKIIQTLTEKLDLTAEQVETLRPVIEENSLKIKEIRNKNKLNRNEIRSEMRRLRWDTEVQLGGILTDEQVDKYLEFKHEKIHRGKFRDGKMRGPYRKTPEQKLERLSATLNLTDEQKLRIEPIIKESMKKRQEVFDKYMVQGRQAMRAEMQAIGDETHEQLSTILTDEQLKKLDKIKEERRSGTKRPGRRGF